jgi:hypothetical protein
LGCIETFNAETLTFENNLVVDALLTNEHKRHEVKLSRTYSFETEEPLYETNATIIISEDSGKKYSFEEMNPGIYTSLEEFGAIPGKTYVMNITTSVGKSYSSQPVISPSNVLITALSAERKVNDLGEEGVSIRLSNISNTSEPSYFRYEYEETYKIIAPNYDPFEFEVIDYIPCDGNFYEVGIKPRVEDKKVCFGNVSSVELLQTSTVGLSENKVNDFLLRFISRDNYSIAHRYSILVRQYVQNQDAYSYYERLGDFSSSDNIFSQIQPGYFEGNVFSEIDRSEKVLGYFEVAAVNEKRIYFNYTDLFPNEPLPPYAVNCDVSGNPELVGRGYHCNGNVCDGACESPLIEAILAGVVVFQSENENISRDMPGPYFTLPSPCGDCTKLGSNIIPDFWIDE